jgi:hypothetical protein
MLNGEWRTATKAIVMPIPRRNWIFCLAAAVAVALALLGWRALNNPHWSASLVARFVDERQSEKRALRLIDGGQWRRLQDGLDLRWLRFRRQGRWISTIGLAALRVDPAKLAVRMVAVPADRLGALDMEALARSTGALALVNASYFEPDLKAMGLLIVDGETVSPPRKEGSLHHGVFFIRGDQAFLQERTDANPEGATQAFQAGPWLVTDGAAQRHFRNADLATRRSAVGLDRQGRVVLAATETLTGGLTLPELADWLGALEPKGLALWRAINCDGGASTQMLLRHRAASFTIRATVHPPVYVGVFAR